MKRLVIVVLTCFFSVAYHTSGAWTRHEEALHENMRRDNIIVCIESDTALISTPLLFCMMTLP